MNEGSIGAAGPPAAHAGSWRWTPARLVLTLAAANLLLSLALFSLRAPWNTPPATLTPAAVLPLQVEQLRTRIKEGRSGEPYTLSLTDDELSATAGYFLAQAPDVPFSGVRVAVTGEHLVVDGVTRGLAVSVPVHLSGTLTAAGGLPRAQIEDVSLGGAPLPAFARDQIVAEANKSLDFSRYPLPLTVETVETRPGGLTLRGTLK